MKKPNENVKTNARKDGEATKALIVECAGRLIAEHGFAAATSKMICEKAKTNQAAVNYHFGSRDGLYVAVLEEVHKHLLSLDFLHGLMESALSPSEKLDRFIDELVSAIYSKDNWYVRVWAREIVTPSPYILQIISKEAVPKFAILRQILSEITGIPPENPALYLCMLGAMAPFVLIFLANRQLVSKVVPPIESSPHEFVRQLKTFVFGGLQNYMLNEVTLK